MPKRLGSDKRSTSSNVGVVISKLNRFQFVLFALMAFSVSLLSNGLSFAQSDPSSPHQIVRPNSELSQDELAERSPRSAFPFSPFAGLSDLSWEERGALAPYENSLWSVVLASSAFDSTSPARAALVADLEVWRSTILLDRSERLFALPPIMPRLSRNRPACFIAPEGFDAEDVQKELGKAADAAGIEITTQLADCVTKIELHLFSPDGGVFAGRPENGVFEPSYFLELATFRERTFGQLMADRPDQRWARDPRWHAVMFDSLRSAPEVQRMSGIIWVVPPSETVRVDCFQPVNDTLSRREVRRSVMLECIFRAMGVHRIVTRADPIRPCLSILHSDWSAALGCKGGRRQYPSDNDWEMLAVYYGLGGN